MLMGPQTRKRGSRGRRQTAGWIKHGGGDGGEPGRSPPDCPEFSPAAHLFIRAADLRRLSGALTFGWMVDAG